MKKKVLFLILLLGFILSGCSKEAVDPFTLPDHGDFELVLTVKTVAGEEVTGEDLVLRLADVKEMSVFLKNLDSELAVKTYVDRKEEPTLSDAATAGAGKGQPFTIGHTFAAVDHEQLPKEAPDYFSIGKHTLTVFQFDETYSDEVPVKENIQGIKTLTYEIVE